MIESAGLLSKSNIHIEEIRKNNSDLKLYIYNSIDHIIRDNYDILLIDFNIFNSDDSIQFFLSRIRKKIHDIPVILILDDTGLSKLNPQWFIDDFIIHPIRADELKKRIDLQIKGRNIYDDSIVIGQIIVNLNEYSVYLKNEKLDLTYKEFEILKLLVQNRGKVFSRKDLLIQIWGTEYIGGTRTVDVHIRRLRGKLGDEFNSVIETVRNVGYRCR